MNEALWHGSEMWIGKGRPKFGMAIVNQLASMRNPRRTGYFVREGIRTGKMNPGRYFELTDCRGNFWEISAPRLEQQHSEGGAERPGGIPMK